MTGLSRRRSRVRVPSLPSLRVPAKWAFSLPGQTRRIASWPNPVAQTLEVKHLQIGQLGALFVSGRTNKNGSRARQVAITLRAECPPTERRVQVIAPRARR